MSKKAIFLIFSLIILGNSSRAGLSLNRDDIINNARVGIDLSGSYSMLNIHLSAESSQTGGNNSQYDSAYLQIQQVADQIRLLKLKLNPSLNTSYN